MSAKGKAIKAKQKLACPSDNCDKELTSMAYLTNHMKKIHQSENDQCVVAAAERHERIEALKLPKVSDSDFLRRTLPAGQLSGLLDCVNSNNKPKEAHNKNAPKQMTCAEYVLGG